MAELADPGVVAVVVTHRPAPTVTAALVVALRPQVDDLVVVDDGSPADDLDALRRALPPSTALLPLGDNRGIAAAQNVGVAWARERGAHHVLLSDQDSMPAADMVARLLDGLARASRRGRVGAVGPITYDERNGSAPLVFSDQRWGPRRAHVPAQDGALVPVTFLIASGCLIPVEVLDAVGPMNEAWFIDHIDLEWGLRARRAGYALVAVVGAGLAHSLGDRTQRIPGRERDVHIHSPLRNYYMARNTVLLIRSGLLRRAWRWGYAYWITKYSVFYASSAAPRPVRARRLVRGLVDGLRGRTGRIPTT